MAGVRAPLGSSRRRCAAVRADRPELVRQARRWMTAGGGLWLGLAAAEVAPFRRAAPARLAWRAAAAAMVEAPPPACIRPSARSRRRQVAPAPAPY